MRRHGELRRPESRLLQAVIFQDAPAVEELLQDGTKLSREVLEFEDEYGYTCCLWSASRGHHRLLKALIGAGANPLHVAHGGKTDATTALHVCAATGRFGSRSDERKGYLECAAVLIAAGANPFAENGKGMTAIEVAIHHNNQALKAYLEGSAIFRGALLMPAAKILGGNDWADRHCVVHPRVSWDPEVFQPGGRQLETGTPVLWMWCYKSATAMRPLCQIPLTGAYVELDSSPASEDEAHALLILQSKVALKGVLGTALGPDNLAIELVGRAEVLRELAFLCSSVQRAVEKGALAELCRAAIVTNFKQQQLLLASFSSSADLERQPGSPGWLKPKSRMQLASTPRSANGSVNMSEDKDMASNNSDQSTDPAVVWLAALNGPSHSLESNLSEQECMDGGSASHSQDANAGWGAIGRAIRKAGFSNSLQRPNRSLRFSVAGLAGSLGRRSEQAGAAAPAAEDRIIEVGNDLIEAGDSDASATRTGLGADTDVTGIVERDPQPGEDDGVRRQPPPRVLDLLKQLAKRSPFQPAATNPLAEDATVVGVPAQQPSHTAPVPSAQKGDRLLQQLAKRLHLRAGKGPTVEVGGGEPSVEELLEQWRAKEGSLSPRNNVGQAPLIDPDFWGESVAQPPSPAGDLLAARAAIEEEEEEDEVKPTPVVAVTKEAGASEQVTADNGQQRQGPLGSPAIVRSFKPAHVQERAFVRSKEDSGRPRVTTEAERMEGAKRVLAREQARALKHAAKRTEDGNGPLRSILESPAASSEARSLFDSMSSDSDDTAMFEEEVRILRHRRAQGQHLSLRPTML